MKTTWRFSIATGFVCAFALAALAACSNGGSGDLVGLDPQTPSPALDASSPAPDAVAPDDGGSQVSDITLETVLRPGQAVNSTGEVRVQKAPGTANDQLRSEATIDKDDFGVLDITPANGFQDEVVRLVATRSGTQVFATRLNFADNNPANIDFKRQIDGAAAPELQAGDLMRVFVNGHLALRGTLRD